jgi:hypothetical protein
MVSKIVLALALAVSFPVRALAQATQLSCTPPGFPGGVSLATSRIGVGTPYTLRAVIKSGMVSANGVKTDVGVTTSFQARDSQGRTQIDEPVGCSQAGGQPHWMGSVLVNDPVANTFTSWRVDYILPTPVAYVKIGSIKQNDPSTAQQEFNRMRIVSQASDQDPEAEIHIHRKVEDLGKRTILGLEASGMRITTTFPAGALDNSSAAALPINQRPYTEVEETWISESTE